MKHLPLLLTIVLSASALAQKTTPSKITRVTLFAKNAQVERLAEAALSKGEQTILFSGLSPKVVQNSIRVRTNRKNVLIRQNAFKTEFTETDVNKSEIETLYKQLDAEKRKLELIDAQKAGLLKEREFLDQNTDINGARGMNMNLTQFQQTGDYFRKKMESVQAGLYDLEVKRNKQKEAINAVTAQLKEKTSVRTDVVGVLAVTVDAESAGPTTFYIDYLVTDAGWQPEYELRVDDIGKPVRLELKARLAQQTNVEWKNVALSFSTGDPQRGSQVPELTTWYITQPVAPPPVYNSNPPTKQNLGYTGRFVGTVKNNETGEGIPSAVVAFISPQGEVMHTELAGYDGSYSFLSNESVSSIQFSAFGLESKTLNVHTSRNDVRLEPTTQKVDEIVVVAQYELIETGKTSSVVTAAEIKNSPFRSIGYVSASTSGYQESAYEKQKREDYERIQRNASQVRKALSQRFEALVPYTVLPTGESVSVTLQEFALPVSYRYSAVPKLDEDAFLEALLVGWDTLGLISGEMKIFVEGNFVGISTLNAATLTDTLSLSLGRDPNVVVQRAVVNGASTKNFFGGKITQQTAYRLEAKNNKLVPITLYLQDQFPLSPDESISIKRGTFDDGIIDPETGIITWKIELKPGEQMMRLMNYEVTYPKNRQVYF